MLKMIAKENNKPSIFPNGLLPDKSTLAIKLMASRFSTEIEISYCYYY